MSKGLIINEDVWDLIDDLDAKETKSLTACLAALHRGADIPPMTRMVKGVFNRIALDNGRFNSEISEIRRQAALKRWHREETESIQNNANVYANDAKMQNAQEKKRIEEKRIEETRAEEKRKAICPLFEHEEVVTAWREWVDMRKQIKKPMVGQAESRAISNLMRLSGGDPSEAVKILNQSTDKCWIGLFALRHDWKDKGKDVFDEWARA